MTRVMLIPTLVLSLLVLPAVAQKKKKKKRNKRRQAAITVKAADADYKFQGEYTGEFGNDDKQKFGLQVIALGGGKFKAVAYPGGLPGAGWNGEQKYLASGSRTGDTLALKGDSGSAEIKGGVATVRDADGNALGSLKRVARKSPTLGKKPPKGAVVLFGGKDSVGNWKNGKVTTGGLLMQGTSSKKTFQSFKLHVEFLLSYMPYARGQGRSNSGIYMQGRYEVQVLDSFGLAGKNNECGGIYEINDPSVNMCLPPLQWQTYDVEFTAARYDKSGKKTSDARLTVRHNGVLIQKDVKVPRSTRGAQLKEGPTPGPIYIQNHGNPLRFRNIWLVETK